MIRDELPAAGDCWLAGTLAMPVPPISPQELSGSVYRRLMHESDSALLAVVDGDGHPVGLVDRRLTGPARARSAGIQRVAVYTGLTAAIFGIAAQVAR